MTMPEFGVWTVYLLAIVLLAIVAVYMAAVV